MRLSMDLKRFEALARTGDWSKEAAGFRLAACLHALHMSKSEFGKATGQAPSGITNAIYGRAFPSRKTLQHLHDNEDIDVRFVMYGAYRDLGEDLRQRLYFGLERHEKELAQLRSQA